MDTCLFAVVLAIRLRQVISFNLGSMGFLTNHDYNSMQEDLREVIDGSETLEQCAIDGSVRSWSSNTVFEILLLHTQVSGGWSALHYVLSTNATICFCKTL